MLKKTLKLLGVAKPYKYIRTKYYHWKLLKDNFTINKNIQWFGLPWCGFYLDVTKLHKNCNVISVGVGRDISFDLALQKKGVKQIYLFDPTPVSVTFIKSIKLPANISFLPYGLSDRNEIVSFYLPINSERISGSAHPAQHLNKESAYQVQMYDLIGLMQVSSMKTLNILKMDIEGSEFKVIENMFNQKIFPEQLCVEFHQRFFDDGNVRFKNIVKLLEENNYILSARSQDEGYLFVYHNPR